MSGENVTPLIGAQLNYLVTHFPLTIKIEQMWSGSKFYPGVIDRFTLAVPYCLDFLKWEVIYDSESPFSARDVVFEAEDETFHAFILTVGEEGGELKSPKNCLSDWDSKDPSRLMFLLQLLRDRYMSYQQKRVGEVDDDRLKFEISKSLTREGIEMHLISGTDKTEEVKFAVPLMDMNINKMVPGFHWRHPQKTYLQVIYPVGKKYASAPSAPRLKLVSTSELEALFYIDEVKLPSWVDGMCLAEYLHHLEGSLRKQVLEAVISTDVRRRFIEALALHFGRPLEDDPVHFVIPIQFPRQQSVLMLQSSQHFNSQGAPIKSHQLFDDPWTPRWEPPTMAERIFEFLVDEAVNFKRCCNVAWN